MSEESDDLQRSMKRELNFLWRNASRGSLERRQYETAMDLMERMPPIAIGTDADDKQYDIGLAFAGSPPPDNEERPHPLRLVR